MSTIRKSLALLLAVLPAAALADNPIIKDKFTADPAALVVKDKVYLYTGHDLAKPTDKRFVMREWLCYSTDDMINWKPEGSPMSLKTFDWAAHSAWASQVIERDGKYYWFATIYPKNGSGYAIGVGVADSPTGPFKDAIGKPLVVNEMTRGAINEKSGKEINWDDLDPTVWIDDDGQAYMIWGNTRCRLAKLKPNMTELDGPIENIDLPKFTEAPWIHKYNNKYYLSYAHDFPEKIAYATADKITGPYTFQKVIVEPIPNSSTSHQSIIQFKGDWYFIYHTAGLPGGGEHRRSVCVERMTYDPDGSIRPITPTIEGVTAR